MTRPPARARFGATELTDEQTQRLRCAVRLEWVSIGTLALVVAVIGLVDSRASTYDDAAPHPLVREVETVLRQQPWVRDVGVRVRDEGHVFHVEGFLAPAAGTVPTLEQLAAARRRCLELDRKIADVVLAPVAELPEDQVPR